MIFYIHGASVFNIHLRSLLATTKTKVLLSRDVKCEYHTLRNGRFKGIHQSWSKIHINSSIGIKKIESKTCLLRITMLILFKFICLNFLRTKYWKLVFLIYSTSTDGTVPLCSSFLATWNVKYLQRHLTACMHV